MSYLVLALKVPIDNTAGCLLVTNVACLKKVDDILRFYINAIHQFMTAFSNLKLLRFAKEGWPDIRCFPVFRMTLDSLKNRNKSFDYFQEN